LDFCCLPGSLQAKVRAAAVALRLKLEEIDAQRDATCGVAFLSLRPQDQKTFAM
jgi:hypothetical protein